MDWLNYNHLFYFWNVARHGSIAKACENLHLTQPTISAQIRLLEDVLGEKLFTRVGRGLALTEAGEMTYRYAEEIFQLGNEMLDTLKGRPSDKPVRFKVGVADVFPKVLAYRLIEPALGSATSMHTTCIEGKPAELLARLAIHEVDLVLSDSPIPPDIRVRGFNHFLGECGVSVLGADSFVGRSPIENPDDLNRLPWLLPTPNTVLRRSLDLWFESRGWHPEIVGEFEDSALLKIFGQAGHGVFPVPEVIRDHVQTTYGVSFLTNLEDVRETFYAISLERKVKHPGVVAIAETARDRLFSNSRKSSKKR